MRRILTSAPVKALLAAAVALALCVVALIGVMRLRHGDLRVPFMYRTDSIFTEGWIKTLGERRWMLHNPRLGAPFGADMYDFPMADDLHFGILKLGTYLSKDPGLLINLYFLLTFALTTLTGLLVLRHFGLSYPTAITGGLLYAFLPYHFMRNLAHLFLGSYYLVPLIVMVMLWICLDRPVLLAWDEENRRRRWRLLSFPALGLVVICVLVSSAGVYYAFFACYLLLIAGLYAYLAGNKNYSLATAATSIALITAGAVGNILPSLIFQYTHGKNFQSLSRQPNHSEIFGLRIIQMLLPVGGHRLAFMRRLKERYNVSHSFFINENDMATLGLVASIGFVILILLLAGRTPQPRTGEDQEDRRVLDGLKTLNVFAVLLATIGGFGAMFSNLVTLWIRCYNRFSVYIAFFALFAVLLLLDRLLRRFGDRPRARRWGYAFVAIVLVAGLLDQTNSAFVPDYENVATEYQSDRQFMARIESLVPERSMIYQLPYVPFPENPPVCRMYDYDHMRGYLHSRTLRWSYASMKGREGDAWSRSVASQPIPQMARALSDQHFAGIYVDRFGYADNGAGVEAQLAAVLGPPTVVSANQRLSFFSFGEYSKRLVQPPPQVVARGE
jgi:phosphoglycerol transferase